MPVVSMKQLLEAGVHFGHQTRRWNPKMDRYIFTQRNGIHIIDLSKTVNGLEAAYEYVRDLTAQGDRLLFVGTKKQAQEAVRDEAMRANQFFVNQRWLGGLLTNFKTIQERLRRLDELERMKLTGEMDLRPKKEQLKLGDEMAKLNRLLGGIRTMRRLPSALFIVDCQKEHLAVHEATRLGIPIVALVDTNADPDPVAYPIPANDDAIRAVRLLAGRIADAAIEGQQMRESMAADNAEESAASSETFVDLATDTGEADTITATDVETTESSSIPGITEPEAVAAEAEAEAGLEPLSEAENMVPAMDLSSDSDSPVDGVDTQAVEAEPAADTGDTADAPGEEQDSAEESDSPAMPEAEAAESE